MVKRQTTLKKKVSKRQTRKFSKKGGRKSMKKPASKQQKMKGGLYKIHGKRNIVAPDKEQLINNLAEDYLNKLDKIHNIYYTSDKQGYYNEMEILDKSYDKILSPTKQNEMKQTAADSIINRNSRDRKKDSIKIIEILKKCNKDGEKSILKTPFTGRDYIKSKFRIKETRNEKNETVLSLIIDGGAKSVEIESYIGSDYFDKRIFLITKKLHDEIEDFLDSNKFNGKGDIQDFLDNVLQSIHPSMR